MLACRSGSAEAGDTAGASVEVCWRRRRSRLVRQAHEITVALRIPRPDAFAARQNQTERLVVGADARFRRDEIRDRWIPAVVDFVYGTKREHLAKVAVDARAWAQLNPNAFSRDCLSVDDVLSSRMISTPLTVRDCCLVTDGAGAFVMVRSDRAKDLRNKPVSILGVGQAASHRNISSMPDLATTMATVSGTRAFEMAGLRPKDVDVLQLYDAFTINVLLFLEDLGFCAKGEAGSFVMSGAIAPGGTLPVNTNGGGLSCVHPGMYGIFTIIEAVEQLRGSAGARQVPNARIALAHGNGGVLSSQATAILGRME
jgi:acetyl-CoA acetyltransferase